MIHLILLWPRYYVGSFDDDANYILTARTLLAGGGLSAHLSTGSSLLGGYPPGFPLLLVPLVWVFPHTFLPLRLASCVSFLAVLPLTWHYMGRRHFPAPVRIATVFLLALNPVMATFGVMVMAEMPFLLCTLLLLLAVERWELSPRFWVPSAVATMVLGAGEVWIKEAGVGLVVGIAIWLVLRRFIIRGVAVAVALGLLLAPVAIARLANNVPLAGTRYTNQLHGYYSGGLIKGAIHVLPHAIHTYLVTALPRALVPYGPPLPFAGRWERFDEIVMLQATIFTFIGLIVAICRYRDAAVVAVPVYMFETLFWPEINERRVILVLPIVVAWYSLGLWTVVKWLLERRWARPPRRQALLAASLAVLALVGIIAPLVAQMPRDYLFGWEQDSSKPGGSRYIAILARVRPTSMPIETDYRNTVSLFTGHPTGALALVNTDNYNCHIPIVKNGIAADHAGWLLIGDLNKPNLIDSRCLLRVATRHTLAVRLLRSTLDKASVFELIGPDTGHPDLINLLARATLTASGRLTEVPVVPLGRTDKAGDEPQTTMSNGAGTLTWTFRVNEHVTQVSVGEAGTTTGHVSGVALQIESPDRTWRTVASANRGVGDGSGYAPFLLATMPTATHALGVRVVVRGTGQAEALDVSALGTSS